MYHNKWSIDWYMDLSRPIILYVGYKAYDVTHFIKIHPGGMKSLISHNGQDVTQSYYFHSKKSHEIWERLRCKKMDKPKVKDDGECLIL